MSTSRDPFGFPLNQPVNQPVASSEPIVIYAQPGQEVRIVVPDDAGGMRAPWDRVGPGAGGDSRVSPRGSGDSRVSPRGSGDSRVSPRGSGDSRVSPRGSGDSRDPFGFPPARRGFSPTPLTIVARSGQEVRIIVPEGEGAMWLAPGDRVSPSGSGDSR